MDILSHRGHWLQPDEKNTAPAFRRSFSAGFGTETDVRDSAGRLVISHDMADGRAMHLDEFFEIYKKTNASLPLAINIKADGLQRLLARSIADWGVEDYFIFDMAVPDALTYCRQGFRTYTRQSEYEKVPAFYDLATGVWLDEFERHWISDEIIASHLQVGKEVCIVSPDLHGRDYIREWSDYRRFERKSGIRSLMLCTDHPVEARQFFDAED